MRRVSAVVLALMLAAVGACRRTHPPPAWQPSLGDPAAPAMPATEPASEPRSVAPAFPPPPTMPMPAPAAVTEPTDGGALAVMRSTGDGGTVNGNPRGPRSDAMNAVLKGIGSTLQRCFDATEDLPVNSDVAVSIAYRVPPSGQPTDVKVTGKVPASASACLRTTVEALRFPEFHGGDVHGTIPLTYRRDQGAQATP